MSSFALHYVLVILLHLHLCIAFAHIINDEYRAKLMNNSLYEVTAFSTHERVVLYNLHIRVDDMIFINGVTNEAAIPMDVLVNTHSTSDFEKIMHANDIEFVEIGMQNMMQQDSDIDVQAHFNVTVEDMDSKFDCYDTIKQWVDYKSKKNPILQKLTIGHTYEKRDIFILKISTSTKNKAVFLLGGEQGRDWMSTAMLLNFVDHILEKKGNLEILIKHYDFYILPILNPDGYMYSITKERLWTKNCRAFFPKKPCSENTSSLGINLDRNWYFEKLTVRNEECDPIYLGPKPLSEEETIAVSSFLNNIAMNMMAFINVRGFENLVTIPYGYENKYCNNYNVLMDIISAVHDLVKKEHNATFSYGLASKYMYNLTGNVADWVKSRLNTPIVYTFYMKVEPFILPSAKNVKLLTPQFSTMIREILLLANTFYGPLFNNQIKHTLNFIILIINLFKFLLIKIP